MNYKKMTKLSARLKYVRAYHNLSQAEMAKYAKTTQQAIQQAEAGQARQPRYLHRLARVLDIPVNWMVFGEAVKDDENLIFSGNRSLNDKSVDVLDNFFSMPVKDQKLIYELMKTRNKNIKKK